MSAAVCRGAEIQTSRTAAPMHLKSYPIDGKLFRVGAVNYTRPASIARTMI